MQSYYRSVLFSYLNLRNTVQSNEGNVVVKCDSNLKKYLKNSKVFVFAPYYINVLISYLFLMYMGKLSLKYKKMSYYRKSMYQSKKMKITSKNNLPESKKLFPPH